MDATGTGLLGRAWHALISAVVAHIPPLLILGIFVLAYLAALDANDATLSFEVAPFLVELVRLVAVLLGIAAIGGLLALAVTRERRRSLGQVMRWLASWNWPEILLLRLPFTVCFTAAISYLHLSFKINIDSFAPYSWDHFFAWLDRRLFLGHDPWVLTHWLMPGTLATQILDTFYMIWFLVMQLSVFGVALLPVRHRLRLTFLTAYGLNWLVGGVLLTILFASAGPVYMERLTGDATFAPLMERLQAQAETVKINALVAQQWLWDGYTLPDVAPYGISAFPSLHLAIAATCACLGFAVNRLLGWAVAIFTFGILLGSVHLGWHYAVDGFAGIALGLGLWRVSDSIAGWWLSLTGGEMSVPTSKRAIVPE